MMRLFLGTVLLVGTACGGVDWRQKTIELAVHPTQILTEAVFHFQNAGKEPIRFSDIIVTCGCMTARPTRPSYAPGEEGTLKVMINLRNREGELRRTIRVRTSDGEEALLAVVIDIPRAYVLSTRLIRWNKEDAMMKKTVHLHNPNKEPIRLLSISSSHASLPAELITIREGFEYNVVVSPAADAGNARSVIRMVTEPPAGEQESKTVKLYAFLP